MRIILMMALSLCLALGSCANLKTAYVAATSSTVPASTIDVAINTFNTVKITAVGYVTYCTPNPTPVGCDISAITNLIQPQIDKGTQARNTLKTFLRAHPGALGDAGVYDTLTTAGTLLKQYLSTYDKRS